MIPEKLNGLIKLAKKKEGPINFTTMDSTGISASDLGYAGAGIGGIAGALSFKDPEKLMGKKVRSKKQLMRKAKPGDIFLGGRVKYDIESPLKILRSKKPFKSKMYSLGEAAFWGGLKPATGSYVPHSVLVESKGKLGKGIHQTPIAERSYLRNVPTSEYYGMVEPYDRLALVRPKISTKQKQKAISIGRRIVREKAPYATASAISQSTMGMFVPKRVRDLFIKRKAPKYFCTGQTCSIFEQAGAPIVKGKGRSALAHDILKSKKVDVVGWAGKPIKFGEKVTTKYFPRVMKGVAGAAALGGLAYGAAKLLGSKKKRAPLNRSL